MSMANAWHGMAMQKIFPGNLSTRNSLRGKFNSSYKFPNEEIL